MMWIRATTRLIAGALICLAVGCTSTPTAPQTSDTASTTPDGPVHRYVAWIEGDLQTGYGIDAQEATRELSEWEGSAPEMQDTDKYLEYLSVLDASGRGPEAEGKIKTYLAKFPSEKRGVFLLAVHYMRARKKELAAYFFKELEKDKAFKWRSLVLNNLGMLALEEKNRIAAVDYFEKATHSSPPHAAPLVNLGAIYLQSRSYSDAENLFRRAAELDKEFEDAVLGLGVALEGQKKFEEAHRVYTEFMSANSNALSVVYNDAILLGNQLRQKEQAAQLMLRYIQHGGKESAKAHDAMQTWR